MEVFLEGIGLMAPGLAGWPASIPVLAGGAPYIPAAVVLPPSPLLPAGERRRTVATVRLALLVGVEAFRSAGRDPGATATVFSSSGGDGDTIHNILEALSSAERDVSPTRFHNSVHNAPSGYWNIATKTREPTTSLCVHDWSFGAGILDAAVQARVDDRAVALIAYDLPYPEPINAHRPINSVFGMALILAPSPTPASFARLTIAFEAAAQPPSVMADPDLEALRAGNPAARSLPLLAALARGDASSVAIAHVFGNVLAIAVSPITESSRDDHSP